MKILITCAGPPKMIGPVRNHLVDVGGTTLIDHTIKQCNDAGYMPVVLADDTQLRRDGCAFVMPPASRWWAETVLSCKEHWGDAPFIILLGDVFFSDYALHILLEAAENGEHRWVGRRSESWISGNGGEPFGFTWNNPDTSALESALKGAIAHAEASPGPRDRAGSPIGSPWQVYRLLIGNAVDMHGFDGKIWQDAVDFSEDFDNELVYLTWMSARRKRWICQKPIGIGNYDRPPGVGPVE